MPDSLPSPRAVPNHKHFLVLRDKPETKAGALDLPDKAQEIKKVGTVVVVGPEVPDHIARGIRLMWLWELSSTVELDGIEYLVMNEQDVAVFLPEVTDGK